MKRMDPRVKGLWVQALRSGEYEQGRGELETVGIDGRSRYCCLGVLCKLAIEEGVEDLRRDERGGAWAENEWESSVLPFVVYHWAGLDNEDPSIAPDVTAINANDLNHWSFEEIADAIEENL